MGASSAKHERLSGRLPPPLIQSIVRTHYPEFERCYAAGLRRDPELQGRIQIRFVIERDGSVGNVTTAGSNLLDTEVSRCIVSESQLMHFPAPDGGIITVVYPLMLSPTRSGQH